MKTINLLGEIVDIPEDYYDGQVTAIINKYRLVITLNDKSKNISVGDVVRVVEPGFLINEGETDDMEVFSFYKATLVVTSVHGEKIIAFSNEKSTSSPFQSAGKMITPRETTVDLNIAEEENLALQLKDEVIRIGNPVQIG